MYIWCRPCCSWGPEDNLQEWILSFNHLGPGDCTQVKSHGSEHLFLLSPDQPFFDLCVLTFILLLLRKTPHSVLAGRHKVTKRSPEQVNFNFASPTIHAQKRLSELHNINCPHVLPFSLNASIHFRQRATIYAVTQK